MKRLVFGVIVSLVLFVSGFVYLTFITNFTENFLKQIITTSEYKVPSESNLFDFKETQGNFGSGEWWVYGQDKVNYFYYDDQVYKISILSTSECQGFESKNYKTWCGSVPVKS